MSDDARPSASFHVKKKVFVVGSSDDPETQRQLRAVEESGVAADVERVMCDRTPNHAMCTVAKNVYPTWITIGGRACHRGHEDDVRGIVKRCTMKR